MNNTVDTGLSEQYIFLRGEVIGKRKLDANVVNPLLREYRRKLESFKVEKTKSDGRPFKIWTDHVDEFTSELSVDSKTLLFSQKLKINVLDKPPHSHNNYAHSIQVEISKGLGRIRVENGETYTRKISITTTGIKFSGGQGTAGRWPAEEIRIVGF